jgi:hypothetical protein
MQEAGIVNFLRTILIILLIYYGFKIVMRFVFPFFVKRFMGKVERKFQEQQGNQSKEPPAKVGETIVDKTPNSDKKSNDSVGEYVDYEEIE